ncbi:ABC transporter substrate-binding protein [Rhodococcus sp. 5G237]
MRLKFAAGCVALALTLAGCGSGSSAPSSAEGDLVIDGVTIADQEEWQAALDEGSFTLYDTYPEEQWRALLDEFTEDTGVEVESVRLVTSKMYERMLSEAGAGRFGADAIGITDITLMTELQNRGITENFESVSGKALPEGRFDPDGGWYSSLLPGLTISYNTDIVPEEEAPKTWEDLLDPKWKGKIGMTPITTGGSTFSLFHFLQETYGREYWEALNAQQPRMYESSVALGQDMVRGEVPITIGNPGVVSGLIEDGAPVTMVFPEDGVPVFQSVVGLVAGAEHPAAAKLYLEWLLSPRGQQVIVEKTNEYPADPTVEGPSVEGVDMPAADSAVLKVPPTEAWFEQRTTMTEDWNNLFK